MIVSSFKRLIVPSIILIIEDKAEGCWLGLILVIKKNEKNESIFAKHFARNYEKNNSWNIRCLVNQTIVPSTQPMILKIVDF